MTEPDALLTEKDTQLERDDRDHGVNIAVSTGVHQELR